MKSTYSSKMQALFVCLAVLSCWLVFLNGEGKALGEVLKAEDAMSVERNMRRNNIQDYRKYRSVKEKKKTQRTEKEDYSKKAHKTSWD